MLAVPRKIPPLAIAFALIAAALVAATWSTRTTVGDAFETVREGQAAAMNASVRSDLGELDGPPTVDDLVEILQDRTPAGLRYLATLDARGNLIAEAGHPLGRPPTRGERQLAITRVGDRLRVETRVAGRRASGRRGGLFIVMEVEPVEARQLEAAANRTLWIGAGAALVLLGVAIALVRRELRRAADARKREHERRLASLGEMSAVLAHEIKNPLASLKGNAQLLASLLPDGEKPRAKADRVVDEARRLEQLVHDLLAFVRTGEISRADTDVGELVRSAAGEHTVDIHIDAPAWPLDRERMRQVLANLIDNAVAAGPPVRVRAAVEHDRLVLEVKDSGPGVADTDRDRIFEPFFTSKTRGTGLGLAIARRICELHGGSISVRNDGGAVFRVEVPR